MPKAGLIGGLVGLLIAAAIFAAAMSSIAAELNALSAASTIDFYRRHFRPGASDAHYLLVSKLATAFWDLHARRSLSASATGPAVAR